MATKVGADLCFTRGDTQPLAPTFNDSAGPLDLTGFTGILLSITSEEDPVDTAPQIDQFAGTLTGTPTDGIILFAPDDQAASDALPPGEYFYDIQWLNAGGEKFTPFKGNFVIQQDRTKD